MKKVQPRQPYMWARPICVTWLLIDSSARKESSTDKTIVIAGVFCGGTFLFICIF
ncbi:hypothetical protein GCK32_019854, partial [Trichostrongylus colubriformis]